MGDLRSIDGGKATAPEGSPRRLAAILVADIAGYSRLMSIDEKNTHERTQRIRRELIDPTIAEHRGRLIKNTGDGFLVMFDSPVEAVRCGIVIQQGMIGRNIALGKEHWIQFRIGINLGDVIVEADDIYGDGVNVAARLESLAEPGTVYISGGIYEQIKYKLVVGYQSLGDQKVKNITDPVSVYRVLPDPSAVAKARTHKRRIGVVSITAIVLLIGGALGGTAFYLRQPAPAPSPTSAAVSIIPPAAPPIEEAVTVAPAPTPPRLPDPMPVAPAPAPPPVTLKPEPAPNLAALVPPVASPKPVASVPDMVAVPGGSFMMGSNDDPSEKPIHRVTLKPFSISRTAVTVGQWKQCVAAKACDAVAAGDDSLPMTNVSWKDTQQYIAWLSKETHQQYRLPTEAEWEYAARAGSVGKYWWGNLFAPGFADCKGCGAPNESRQPQKVASYPANAFGLHDMGGNVDQWVEDCWHTSYHGAPSDGSAWMSGDCMTHVLRSGSWRNDETYIRPSNRDQYDVGVRYPTHGFRIAHTGG